MDKSSVQLTAVPESGWSFSGWSGDLIDNTNPIALTMDTNKKVVATFQRGYFLSFPATTFNLTPSITTKIIEAPFLLNNWKATINNTIQWGSPNRDPSPRIVLGFFSSMASPRDPSIQLIAYNNGSIDVISHNSTHPNGYKLQTLKWANSLTISHISNTLTILSPGGDFQTSFPSFGLAFITCGSTQSDTCSGGKVEIQVECVQ